MKKFFIGLNHNIENKVFKVSLCGENDELYKIFEEKFNDEFGKDLINILDLLTNILIHCLAEYYILNLDLDLVKTKFNKQINIVRKGIYK